MNKKFKHISSVLKEELRLFLSISFGVFLFVLFFQPFTINRFDFNNRLIFIAGLGGIVFLWMVLVRVIFRRLILNNQISKQEFILSFYIDKVILLVLNSVAFAFYLKYVGHVSITFYSMFKVVLICLVPIVVIRLYELFMDLKAQNELLRVENKTNLKQIKQYNEDYLNKTIEFISENNTDNLNLLITDVVFIKSADNYVEVIFKEGGIFKKQLLRNTLKNIELQLKPYSNFIRCHRTCIINIHYIQKLNKIYNNHWLILKGYPEQIPVSRQYLVKLKEAL